MDDVITRGEHDEFVKRMEDENHRQNHRLELLEKNTEQLGKLAGSVEKLAANMENMLKVQKQQGERLEELEGRDGEMWRKVSAYVITAVIGIVVGYIFTQIGM